MKLRSGKIAKKPRLANVPDDFALLPNEIKRDIIDVGMFQERTFDARDLDDLKSDVEGSWAEHAKQAAETCRLRRTKDDEFLRRTKDDEKTNAHEMKHRAAELYEYLNLKDVDEDVYNLLEHMGTRFSCVIVSERSDYLELPITRQLLANFLERQLKSKYLRRLVLNSKFHITSARKISNLGSEGSKSFHKLNLNLCIDFVKRPQFEKLHLDIEANLPFEIFEEAHKSWEAAERFEVRRKRIRSGVSKETLKKMEKYWKIKVRMNDANRCDSEFHFKHPAHSTAKMKLKVNGSLPDNIVVRLSFLDLSSNMDYDADNWDSSSDGEDE